MPIATSTALIIGGIASAASHAAAAKIQANSANKAANIQADYGNQALADARTQRAREQQIQDQQRAEYDAWRNSAAMQLGVSLRGGAPTATTQPAAPISGQPTTTMAQMRATPTTASGPMGQAMVMLQSPDGTTTRSFAATDPRVQHYTSLGAKVVG